MTVRPRRAPSRTAPRQPQAARWPTVATVCILVLVVLITGGGAWLTSRSPKLDPETLCPASGASAVTVLLIDSTDGLSAIQRAATDVRLRRIAGDLQLHEQVAVYRINPNGNPLSPVFTVCRPTRPEEQNELTGSRKLAQKTFDMKFRARLQAALEDSLSAPGAERSPIMEAIQGVAVGSFQPLDDGTPKRLIVVSDMLENGAGGSHYAGKPNFADFSQTQAFARTRSDLTDVEVTILYLRRDDGAGVQGRTHAEFWAQWFAAQGASVEDVKYIEG